MGDELTDLDELLQPTPLDDGSSQSAASLLGDLLGIHDSPGASESSSEPDGSIDEEAIAAFVQAVMDNDVADICLWLACGENPTLCFEQEGVRCSPLRAAVAQESNDALFIMLATRKEAIMGDLEVLPLLGPFGNAVLAALQDEGALDGMDVMLGAFAKSGDSSAEAHLRLFHFAATTDDWMLVCRLIYHCAGRDFDLSAPLAHSTEVGRTPLEATWGANPQLTMSLRILLAARADPFSQNGGSFYQLVKCAQHEGAQPALKFLDLMYRYMYGSDDDPSEMTDPSAAVSWLMLDSGIDWDHSDSSQVEAAVQALQQLSLAQLSHVLTSSLEQVEQHVDARLLLGYMVCIAAKANDIEAVYKLLSAECDSGRPNCNLCDERGRSALSYAAANGNPQIILGLIHAGACFNRLDRENLSALGTACQEGHVHGARAFLEARADVNGAYKGRTYVTPLMLACDSGAAECVALLLEHQANLDIHLVDVPQRDSTYNIRHRSPLRLRTAPSCSAPLLDRDRIPLTW